VAARTRGGDAESALDHVYLALYHDPETSGLEKKDRRAEQPTARQIPAPARVLARPGTPTLYRSARRARATMGALLNCWRSRRTGAAERRGLQQLAAAARELAS
jgi:hypothetical protein